MVYKLGGLQPATQPIREAIGWGVKLIAGVLGLSFFATEARSVLSQPFHLRDVLYIALLFSVGLLIAAWIWVSRKELALLSRWLDPTTYEPPEETIVILGIAASLCILLFAARRPLAFGIAYVLYAGVNLGAWMHFRNQLIETLKRSRDRLAEEGIDVPGAAPMCGRALDRIEQYYLRRPQLFRLFLVVVLGTLGLTMAVYGTWNHNDAATSLAYGVYFLSVFAFEEILITGWRLSYYASMRPLSAEMREAMRKSGLQKDD